MLRVYDHYHILLSQCEEKVNLNLEIKLALPASHEWKAVQWDEG